ncbi:MAG: hypothetical protein GY838_07110 [bacterium]|nr:hypothetical protein [bacterium]
MPQTIAQMGQVAKTQAKGQHQSQPVAPFSEQLDKQEELRVKRVKETEAADKQKIEREDDAPDKRQRRRKRRRRKIEARDTEEPETTDEDQEVPEAELGNLVDLHA